MQNVLHAVTDLADQAVVLPIVFVATLALAALGWRRGALGWSAAAATTLGAILLLKLVATACRLTVESPSGHTAAAGLLAGGLAWLFTGRRWAALTLAASATIVIAATRLALGVHSPAEVLVGAAVGLTGAVAIVRLTGPPPDALRRRVLALVLLACLFSTYGKHLGAESFIRDVARSHACCLYRLPS